MKYNHHNYLGSLLTFSLKSFLHLCRVIQLTSDLGVCCLAAHKPPTREIEQTVLLLWEV